MTERTPGYYRITSYIDVFDWLSSRPIPGLPLDSLMTILPLYSHALPYIVRLLWKEESPKGMAKDCRKAIHCLQQLCEKLEALSFASTSDSYEQNILENAGTGMERQHNPVQTIYVNSQGKREEG